MAPCTGATGARGADFSHIRSLAATRSGGECDFSFLCNGTVNGYDMDGEDDGMNGWMASSGVGEVDEGLI